MTGLIYTENERIALYITRENDIEMYDKALGALARKDEEKEEEVEKARKEAGETAIGIVAEHFGIKGCDCGRAIRSQLTPDTESSN
jgi:hypothetical protein